MARGIFTNLAYPFGYYASTGLSGDQLKPLIWEATRILELIGFNVRAWTSDGASQNRECFDINAAGEDCYFTENSHGNNNTKALHVRYFFYLNKINLNLSILTYFLLE